MTRTSRLLLSSCCAALLATTLPATEPRASEAAAVPSTSSPRDERKDVKAAAPTSTDATNAEAVPASGYVIGRDPSTGALRTPSASEIQALIRLDASRRSSLAILQEESGVKGSTKVRLKGRFRHYMTVQVGEDARLHSGCAQEEEHVHVAR
jgi:hypothetical protein